MGIVNSNMVRQDLGARPGRGRNTLVGAVTPPDEPSSETPAPADDYDPADHHVVDVIAYIDEHPDARERVLQLERDGKARVSLIAALEG